MKNIKLEIISKYKKFLGLLILLFLYSCGSYENASVQNDGIYASDDITSKNVTQNNTKSDYYKNYFEEQSQLISDARSYSEVFTNIEDYSSEYNKSSQEVNVTNDSSNNNSNNNYGGWGTQPTSVTINYIDNGFWGPNFAWGIQNNWAWGGLNPGWGWSRFNGIWGGIYGPAWGYGAGWSFGWGGAFGWGNFRPWGGWGVPAPWRYAYNNWNMNSLYGTGLAFHRNSRARSSHLLNRGRSSIVRMRSNVNSDRRLIRNSNINARVRTNRVNRNQYNRNRTIRNNRENSRIYTPRTNTRTRSTRNYRVRSSSRSSSPIRVRSSRGSSRSSGTTTRRRGDR